MSFVPPSLFDNFKKNGDIRIIIQLIEKYTYNEKDIEDVIHIYEPYIDYFIPEVEHIEVLISYFPKSKISESTINAIKKSFPDRLKYILK